MRKSALILILSAVSAGSFFLGSLYGFKQGIINFAYLDQLPQGAISASLYKQANAGNIEFIKQDLNINVDLALDSYVNYLTEGNSFYSNIFLSEHTHGADSYLKRLAAFRNEVPTVDVIYGENDAERAEYAERLKLRNALLEKYGYVHNGNANHQLLNQGRKGPAPAAP